MLRGIGLQWWPIPVWLLATGAFAATDRYDYDALGRLIRWVDETGQVTDYAYDAAGNLLQVQSEASPVPLAVGSVAPAAVRRGDTRDILITGTSLAGSRLSPLGTGLSVSGFSATADTATFRLGVSETADLGLQTFVLENALGQAEVSIRIDPVLPRLSVAPMPLAVPPDGVERPFSVTLSNADAIDHTVTLASADPDIATFSPASLTMPAGEIKATALIAGKQAGTTALTLSAPDLAGTSVPVFVTSDFSGVNTSMAPLVGVTLRTEPPPPASRSFGPVASPALGVSRGILFQSLAPNPLAQGQGPVDLLILGQGLSQVSGIQILPSDGLMLGPATVQADGTGVSVPVSVAADAPLGWRRVVLSSPATPYVPATPEADRLLIAPPPPRIDSVEPLFAQPGDTLTLTVRGRHLQNAGRVAFWPEGQLVAGNPPAVNADGTQLTTGLSVGVLADPGPRVVRVTTPGGETGTEGGPSNTLTVVEQPRGSVSPIAAPLLGIVKETTAPSNPRPVRMEADPVGVALGPIVAGLEPTTGAIGSTLALAIEGGGLNGVSQVQFIPPDGLTVGAPVADADGHLVTVNLAIAPDAPQTPRRLAVKAGTVTLPTLAAEATTFSVTAPLPVLDSISPLYVVAGEAPVTLTLRGRNFQNAAFVRVMPGSGLSVGWPPAVNADGTEATVSVAAAADAAPGPRAVALETLGGGTGALATVANTLIVLAHPPHHNVAPVAAPAVGILKETASPPPASREVSVVSAGLGVVVPATSAPGSSTGVAYSPALGLAVGPVALDLAAPYLTPGAEGSLTIQGKGLDAVASAVLAGPSGVVLGTPSPAASGTTLSLPISVGATASAGGRRLTLLDGAAHAIPFADPARAEIRVAAAPPRIDSIDPILARQGEGVVLKVRGAYLNDGRVIVEPSTGLSLEPTASTNAAGAELTLRFQVSGDAPLGGRVIRVETPGGLTAGEAAPANTFTVYPP